jgi:peptidyl-prolyl cis-trans isomerase SurA
VSRRVLSALALATVLVAGTGCGVNGTGFRPGVAADVGDERVYTEVVDDAADKACDYFSAQDGAEAFPKAQLRGELLQLVVQQAAVEQLLEENDLDVPAVPEASVQDFLDQQFAGATDRQAEGLGVGAEAVIVVQSGLTALGTQLLRDEGQQVDPSQQDAAVQRGFEALSQWLLDNEVELNPVYGVTLDEEGRLSAEADDTSVVVSEEAGYAAQPDAESPPSQEEQDDRQAYLDSLPASQTCG